MSFGVFIHRADSIYDDSPAERYQFPPQYLDRVKACVGDWIVYYEPRKVTETRGYFAVAKVQRVIADPGVPGMYLALIEPGTYLDFADPVPFASANGVMEQGLLNAQRRISGRAQSAVRPLSITDFNRIIEAGLGRLEVPSGRGNGPNAEFRIREEQALFQFEESRDRVNRLTSRVMRDRVFRQIVLRVYEARCAVTGLKLINGAGRAEVEAAHIKPVDANGPDIICNGIALSGTAHWMFDRGLISLEDDLQILISRQVNDQDQVRALVNNTGRALVPPLARPHERPHPHFLKWHRENCFKN
jgi:putative restriction endonuclease